MALLVTCFPTDLNCNYQGRINLPPGTVVIEFKFPHCWLYPLAIPVLSWY